MNSLAIVNHQNQNAYKMHHQILHGDLINWLNLPHLSKGPSDLKQKCTQLPTPFSGTLFDALSLGVIHFIWSVSLRNHFLVCFFFNFSRATSIPINFHLKVFKAANKMDHTMWKSMKNYAWKWCRKLCAFLFAATWAFGKMCYVEFFETLLSTPLQNW